MPAIALTVVVSSTVPVRFATKPEVAVTTVVLTSPAAADNGTGDGAEAGLERVFQLGAGNDYLEIAHLEMRNYGRYSPGALSGFVVHGPRGDGLDYVYYHDLEVRGINMERLNDGGRKFAISLFSSGLHWTNFTNLLSFLSFSNLS